MSAATRNAGDCRPRPIMCGWKPTACTTCSSFHRRPASLTSVVDMGDTRSPWRNVDLTSSVSTSRGPSWTAHNSSRPGLSHWSVGSVVTCGGCRFDPNAPAAIVMDAFGFFETEEEHAAVLREAARVLTTGGHLGLKVVNGGPVLDTFRESDRDERDGTVVSISRTLTLDPPRMTERISVSGSRGHGEYERRQRLYRVEELRAALQHAGFAIVGVFARPDGTPFEPTLSSTMWIVGQRCAV